jgi:hypothetical protein
MPVNGVEVFSSIEPDRDHDRKLREQKRVPDLSTLQLLNTMLSNAGLSPST